jgi:hypothetical protein
MFQCRKKWQGTEERSGRITTIWKVLITGKGKGKAIPLKAMRVPRG